MQTLYYLVVMTAVVPNAPGQRFEVPNLSLTQCESAKTTLAKSPSVVTLQCLPMVNARK
jgi:hypothetical protein